MTYSDNSFSGASGASYSLENTIDSELGAGISKDVTGTESFEDVAKKLGGTPLVPPATPENKVETVRSKNEEWYNEPTYRNQFQLYPEHCRITGPKFKVFDLDKGEEIVNTFMEGSLPEEAPKIIIKEIQKEFIPATANWKLLVTYYQVQYKQLLSV